jgi:uncharacterized protein
MAWAAYVNAKAKGAYVMAITDLGELLRSMTPELHDAPYGFGLIQPKAEAWVPDAFAMMVEDEGVTVVATEAVLRAQGITHQAGWARISLKVHSDLQAVGLTAAVATALTAHGISANVIAGYHHDHFFVQWARRFDAMQVLAGLSDV